MSANVWERGQSILEVFVEAQGFVDCAFAADWVNGYRVFAGNAEHATRERARYANLSPDKLEARRKQNRERMRMVRAEAKKERQRG